MNNYDEISDLNKAMWEDRVHAGHRNSLPWLEPDTEQFRAYREGRRTMLPPPYDRDASQQRVLEQAHGTDVLCLAGGGGQQSAVYGLLGAHVTVLDIAEGQLQRDREAADSFGYDIDVVQGDMTDLSMFRDNTFGIVEQPVSIVFAPDVGVVYNEVYRVLKPGGWYRVVHLNPSTYPVDFAGGSNGWDGTGYRITEPYCGGPLLKDAQGVENMRIGAFTGEFRHTFSDIFNKLIATGMVIQGVWEDHKHLVHDTHAEPGTEAHQHTIIQLYFTILAQKV